MASDRSAIEGEPDPRQYEAPRLIDLGSLEELTLAHVSPVTDAGKTAGSIPPP